MRCLRPLAFMLLVSAVSMAARQVAAQEVVGDSIYAPRSWSVVVDSAFGASQSHEQRLAGGNPGAFRYMRHVLPAPPGPQDLTTISVAHVYEGAAHLPLDPVDHVDFFEDVRLLSLPWQDAFIRSFPLVRQDGRLFRSDRFIQAVGDTAWVTGSLTGLREGDFNALDGSGDHPDFSDRGGFLFFGFWRVSSRGATLPPVPAGEELVYEHASDNLRVMIHGEPPPNQPPDAGHDEFLYLDFFSRNPINYPLLRNDSDPEGDPIRISNVLEPAFGGTILSFTDSTVSYSAAEVNEGLEGDFFLYRITDGMQESSEAFVSIYFCYCPLACIAVFLAPRDSETPSKRAAGTSPAQDSLEVDLFRDFRDRYLQSTEAGEALIETYYRFAREAMPLLLFQRIDLGMQAMRALELMQVPLRDLVTGEGTAEVSQALVDSVSAVIDAITEAASDTLAAAIAAEISRIGPLQEYVGLSIAEAVERAFPGGTGTAIDREAVPREGFLRQNYPNPFGAATTIAYELPAPAPVSIRIYTLTGRRVVAFAAGIQSAGTHALLWDGRDSAGRPVPDGVYFYELEVGSRREVRKMVVLR